MIQWQRRSAFQKSIQYNKIINIEQVHLGHPRPWHTEKLSGTEKASAVCNLFIPPQQFYVHLKFLDKLLTIFQYQAREVANLKMK